MGRIALVGFLFVVMGAGSRVYSQTYDELVRENRTLRARIAAYEPDDAHSRGDAERDKAHAHEDHPSHGESGHDDSDRRDHGESHCQNHCQTHFDFFCPFEDHHGGHGHCGLCGNGYSHGKEGHGAGDADGHGDEHNDAHAHGPAYHHSIDGYPLLHSARSEFFFIERHFHFVLADTRGADAGAADELEFEAEILYAINSRIALIAAVPVISLNPSDVPGTSGIGDLEFGFRFLAFNGKRDGVFFGLNAIAPTGDADRDLGAGHTTLEPVAAWVHDFGRGNYWFNTLTWEMPLSGDESANLLRYDLSLLHTFVETANAPWFRYFTPSFEVNTQTVLNGPEAGLTVVDFTPGVTWVVREEDEIAIGWSFPIAGDRNFDNQFLVNYIRHF